MIDLFFAHVLGMAFIMVEDEFSNPIDIRLLSPFAVVFSPEIPAHLVKEFWFLGGKSFYSVVAQENPHFIDSEPEKVVK